MTFKKDDIVRSTPSTDDASSLRNFIIISVIQEDYSYLAQLYPTSDDTVYTLKENHYIRHLSGVEIAKLHVGEEDRPFTESKEMDKFNSLDLVEGDRVELKSNGPIMTVSNISEYSDIIECMWFDKNNNINQHEFKSSMLIKLMP